VHTVHIVQAVLAVLCVHPVHCVQAVRCVETVHEVHCLQAGSACRHCNMCMQWTV